MPRRSGSELCCNLDKQWIIQRSDQLVICQPLCLYSRRINQNVKNGESPVSHDRTLLNHGWSSWGLRGPHPSQAATYAENCQGISRLVSEAVSSHQNISCNRVTDSPLSSLSLLSSVAVGGFEEMAGDQMKLRSG